MVREVRELREVGIGPSSHRQFRDGVSYARWGGDSELFLASLRSHWRPTLAAAFSSMRKLVGTPPYSMMEMVTTVMSIFE